MTTDNWTVIGRRLDCGPRALVLGIVNVTPDSFSDGGRFFDPAAAVEHGLRLVAEGADLLDVGGESTRPGSQPVPAEEEIRRVVPVVRELALQTPVPISVDTSKAVVARECLEAGAAVINDVTAMTGDPDMAAVVRESGAGVILMHMQGTPATMQLAPRYGDVVAEVGAFLEERLHALDDLGISREQAAIDPGIGFGKTDAHNLRLLAGLGDLRRLGRPICLGVSRKGLLGRVLGRPTEGRLAASLAAACYGLAHGAVQIVRVHDVAATRDAVLLLGAVRSAGGESGGRTPQGTG
jgi:dihydropteroate synthase